MESQHAARDQPIDQQLARQILDAIATLNFGAVEVTIHDGRVVQIDRRERIRIPPSDQSPKR